MSIVHKAQSRKGALLYRGMSRSTTPPVCASCGAGMPVIRMSVILSVVSLRQGAAPLAPRCGYPSGLVIGVSCCASHAANKFEKNNVHQTVDQKCQRSFFLESLDVEITPPGSTGGRKESFSMRKTSYCDKMIKVWRPRYQEQ